MITLSMLQTLDKMNEESQSAQTMASVHRVSVSAIYKQLSKIKIKERNKDLSDLIKNKWRPTQIIREIINDKIAQIVHNDVRPSQEGICKKMENQQIVSHSQGCVEFVKK